MEPRAQEELSRENERPPKAGSEDSRWRRSRLGVNGGDPHGRSRLNGPDRPVEILLVEDNPADVRLTREVLENGRGTTHINVVADGEEAMAFMRREGEYAHSPRPKLVMLDLNLPKKDGREVLEELKSDPDLSRIPVIVLTTSAADTDIHKSYDLHANCVITKPMDLDEFFAVVRMIEDFWLATARLPSH